MCVDLVGFGYCFGLVVVVVFVGLVVLVMCFV